MPKDAFEQPPYFDHVVRDNIASHMLHTTIEVRAAGEGAREFVGIGVPYNTPVDLGWGEYESFDPGAVQLHDQGALVLWQHNRQIPIGVITTTADTDAGFEVTGRLSTTPAAEDAYTLLRDGVITRLSIGFQPVEWRVDEDGIVHHTKVIAREFSLVSFPAYDDAQITTVRARTQAPKEITMPTETEDRDLTALRGEVSDLSRAIDALRALDTDPTPFADRRSAGAWVKALAAGDADTVRAYEAALAAAGIGQTRAFDGGTIADAITKDVWVADLIRIFDSATGVLSQVFSSGTLPSTGMNIEFGELADNTVTVAEKAETGDITFGKVSITSRTAAVKTYAGGAAMTRLQIERATIGLLNTTLEAMATAAGARKKAVLRTAYDTLVTSRRAVADNGGVVVLGATLAAATAGNWEDLLVDAALKFEAQNLPMENLVVSGSVFKKLRSLTVAGERVFQTAKDNSSGTLDLPGLSGDFAGLPVRLDSGQVGDSAVFTNARAIRQYDSALVSLTDENIVNLSKSFAVYRYGAVAAEIPAGVVPVKLSA